MLFESDYADFATASVRQLEITQEVLLEEGAVVEAPYDNFRIALLEFSPKGLLTEETWFDANGWEMSKVEKNYNKKGQVVQLIENDGEETVRTEFQFNGDGQTIAKGVKGEGRQLYSYNEQGLLERIASAEKKSPLAFEHIFTYDEKNRLAHEQVRAEGKQNHAIRYTYDDDGRVINSKVFDNQNKRAMEDVHKYNEHGETWKRIWVNPDKSEQTVTYERNAAGQITAAKGIDHQGEVVEEASFSYNSEGLREKQKQSFFENGKKHTEYHYNFNYSF